jgi:mercuric ion binding protein
MKPAFLAAVIAPALVAGGVFMAGDFSAARVASPPSVGASGPVQQAAAERTAAERTVTLTVDNMYCASCPYIVKQSLAAVPGVKDVSVSFRNQTAIVTFDSARTNVAALTDATFEMGYPSEVKSQ